MTFLSNDGSEAVADGDLMLMCRVTTIDSFRGLPVLVTNQYCLRTPITTNKKERSADKGMSISVLERPRPHTTTVLQRI